jgi:hypothetical protein
MSEKEEKLKKLENKIDDLSKRLGDTQELIFKLHQNLLKVSGVLTQTIEERRKEDEKMEKKFEILIYYRSLVMGLILGIVGNMFVSYLMKGLEIFNIPSEGWILVTIVALAITFTLIWLFNREVKKVSKQISSSKMV